MGHRPTLHLTRKWRTRSRRLHLSRSGGCWELIWIPFWETRPPFGGIGHLNASHGGQTASAVGVNRDLGGGVGTGLVEVWLGGSMACDRTSAKRMNRSPRAIAAASAERPTAGFGERFDDRLPAGYSGNSKRGCCRFRSTCRGVHGQHLQAGLDTVQPAVLAAVGRGSSCVFDGGAGEDLLPV